ncbi:MAG: TIGR03545 family protein [Exilibacterium sp.]
MKKVFRLYGLAIFVVVVALMTVGIYLFTDSVIETAVEVAGTEIVGAKVELGHVDIDFSEQSIEFNDLQITNPDEPMFNALEVKRLAFDMQVKPLAFRRVYIDEMAATGVTLNSPRRESGAIASRADTEEAGESTFGRMAEKVALPSLTLPSVEEVMKQEQLQTLKIAAELESQYEERKQTLKQKIEQLPTKEDIDAYKARVQKLKTKDKDPLALLSKAKELKQLKQDIDRDLSQVKSVRGEVAETIRVLKEDVQKAKAAPRADIDRLAKKYSLSAQGAVNLAERLFGREVAGWLDKGWRWYKKLQPFLGQNKAAEKSAADNSEQTSVVDATDSLLGQGRDIHFAETHPAPDFLIRHLSLSNSQSDPRASLLSGEINNFSDRPGVWEQPISLNIQGEKLGDISAFDLQGNIDRRQSQTKDVLKLQVQRMAVKDLVLSQNPQLPLVIKSAVMDINTAYTMNNGRMDLNVDLALDNMVTEETAPASASAVVKAILSALAKLQTATFHIAASGDVEKPQVSIQSDLDNMLGDIIKRQLAEKTAAFKEKLQAEVIARTKGSLSRLDALDGEVGQLLAQIEDKNQALGGLLKKI